jgi:protocatechuate 3,4-dioxygenase alpha subunit
MTLPLTPSQTVGPYFSIGLDWPDGPHVVPDDHPGAIRISGRVLDGAGEPVTDALIETWQADPDGRFADGAAGSGFRGFGRCGTDPDGRWSIVTLKPGRLPTPDGRAEAPHINVTVLARGLLDRVVTRLYFPDEPDANAADPVLTTLPVESRETLVARADPDGLRFDIHLQGPHETVFFTL